jgi:hypothetical protein
MLKQPGPCMKLTARAMLKQSDLDHCERNAPTNWSLQLDHCERHAPTN